MDNNTFQNYPHGIEIVGGTIEVTSRLNGRSLISGLWRTIFTSSLVQDGDCFMNRSRTLLQRHLRLMQLQDQYTIRDDYDSLKDMRDNMEDRSGTSQLTRNLEAREYRRLAKETYKLIERASARAMDNFLKNQMGEATRPPGLAPGDGPGPVTRYSFATAGEHALSSTITDINVNDVVRVDVSAYQDKATNEMTAVFDVIGRDRSVKHVLAFAGDRRDMGASQPTASGLHQKDYLRPGSIAACISNVSELDRTVRVDEEVETSTLDSFAISDLVPPEGNHPNKVMRASVPPVDNDTRCFPSRSRKR